MFITLLELIGSLLSIGMIPLFGQLNNSVAGLGSPSPSGTALICNKAIHESDLVSKHFDCPLYKSDTHFHLFIALVIIR